MEFVRSLGADQVIDKAEPFERRIADVDLVFDLVNGDTQERSWAVLKQGGTMISTLTKPSEERAKTRAARAEHYMAQPDADELREIGALIDAGKVRPHIQAVFRYPMLERRSSSSKPSTIAARSCFRSLARSAAN
jgi:NADPH:quinone reductase-like Zn-dependent oxidoreductase